MCGSPDGYGSISSTYERSTPASVSFETSHVRSAAHTCCHRRSIAFGSYRSAIGGLRYMQHFPSKSSGTIVRA